jgi:Ni/Co efflux regulator RcnB
MAAAAALVAALLAAPAGAQGIEPGDLGAVQRDRGEDARPDRPSRPERPGKFRRKHHVPPRAGWPWVVIERRDTIEPPPRAIVEPEPEPEEPTEGAPEEAETGPPDPGSPRSVSIARGAEPGEASWEVGEPLPAGVPQVTLDWRTYGLSEPEPGRIYARVGRDVLLIEADSRRVIRRIAPGTDEAGGAAGGGAGG